MKPEENNENPKQVKIENNPQEQNKNQTNSLQEK